MNNKGVVKIIAIFLALLMVLPILAELLAQN